MAPTSKQPDNNTQEELQPLLDTPVYASIAKNFQKELLLAAEGKASSLAFIKHILSSQPLISDGIVQGIVIGGTNYIISTQRIQKNGKREILSHDTGVLPILKDRATLEQFIRKHADPRAQAIGINLGFPLQPATGPFGELDGVLATGTKEHTFRGVVGKSIGSIVRETLQRDIPVSVANDTVCLALAGDGSAHCSLIAGTGFNIGITTHEDGKETIINLEAGNFNDFVSTDVLQTIDQSSEQPGKQLFEKCVSGKYLALYFNKKAEALGIQIAPLTTSQELSALSQEADDSEAHRLARELLRRSAGFVAAALAGVYLFCGRKPLTFVAEGSLLWYGWEYKKHLDEQLMALGVPARAMTITHVEDSSINGAIALVSK